MSLSALFEVSIAILGVASAAYLIYAYYEFLKEVAHMGKVHHFHHRG